MSFLVNAKWLKTHQRRTIYITDILHWRVTFLNTSQFYFNIFDCFRVSLNGTFPLLLLYMQTVSECCRSCLVTSRPREGNSPKGTVRVHNKCTWEHKTSSECWLSLFSTAAWRKELQKIEKGFPVSSWHDRVCCLHRSFSKRNLQTKMKECWRWSRV